MYNTIAEEWAEARGKAGVSALVTEFAGRVRTGGRILDIGCGTGWPVARYLSEKGFAVTGIDVSERMLEKAVAQGMKNASFHLCDFWDYVPDEPYDGIIAFDSFFHFPKARQCEIYVRVSEWLVRGGRLLFTHGNVNGEVEGTMFGEVFYYSALSTAEVHTLLAEAGFEIEVSLEKYKEGTEERDLVIVARKLQ